MSDEEESSEVTDATTDETTSETNLNDETTETGSTDELKTHSTSETSAGSTYETSTDSTYETSTGSTYETSTGSTYETSTGSTCDTTTGSTYETTTGSTYETTTEGSEAETEEDYATDHDRKKQDYLLPGEILNLSARCIRAEDFKWALAPVPELASIIVKSSKYIQGPGLANLMKNADDKQSHQILEILPLTIPFIYTLPIIENGIYWERQCLTRWLARDIWRYHDNWKTMLVERLVTEAIENFIPGESDVKHLENFLKTFQNYNFRLQIQKLRKIERENFTVDLALEDFEDLLDEFINQPDKHRFFLNFELALGCLSNLKDFSFVITPSSMDNEHYQLCVTDFNSLLKGLRKLQKLEKFRCSNGIATNAQLSTFSRYFINHKFLKVLDLSYNFIDDECCDSIAQLLLSSCPMEVLILKYNRIADEGAVVISSALTINKRLKKLDVSLNWIGNKGGEFLAKAILTSQNVEDMDISSNKLGPQAGSAFADVIKNSSHLRNLNLAENNLGQEAGKIFKTAVTGNSTILNLNIKFCRFSAAEEDGIHQILIRNRTSVTFTSYVVKSYNVTASEYII